MVVYCRHGWHEESVLKVLKLSAQGLPQSWISLEQAVIHYAAEEVRWEIGAHEQLRSAWFKSFKLGSARGARPWPDAGCRPSVRPALLHFRPCGPRPQARARTWIQDLEPALCALEA